MSLPASFFARDTVLVAEDLIGAELACNGVRARITCTEAYCFPDDTANHAHRGRTRRNAPMWGPPGHAYVYLCYGIHRMLNLVTEADGRAAAVLIRGAVAVEGLDLVRARRGSLDLDGPGKVGVGLDIPLAWSGLRLGEELQVHPRKELPVIGRGPRVGIGYAHPRDQAAPWRFWLASG